MAEAAASLNGGSLLYKAALQVGQMLYLVPIQEHMFGTMEEIPDYIGDVIPMFLVMIFTEAFIGKLLGLKLYRLNDTIISISMGLVQGVSNLFKEGLEIYLYIQLFNKYALFAEYLPHTSYVTWVVALLGVDFGYYWFHRLAHTYQIAWATHIVHHSGEDYNFATALRQGSLQFVYSMGCYMPLALLGLSPTIYVVNKNLNLIYQFWVHTTLIGWLGPLEWIFNTPAAHRMHHRPPGNCNYAGYLIIWDRMFGTYVQEQKTQDYFGMVNQVPTWDPVWMNTTWYVRVFKHTLRAGLFKGLTSKRAKHPVVFQPGVVLSPIPAPPQGNWPRDIPVTSKRKKFNGYFEVSPLMKVYLSCQFLITLVCAVKLLREGKHMSSAALLFPAFLILWSLTSIARLFDDSRRRLIETLRVICLAVLTLYGRETMLVGNATDMQLVVGFSLTLWLAITLLDPVQAKAHVVQSSYSNTF
jgi:alkylglycerol monooxygenase